MKSSEGIIFRPCHVFYGGANLFSAETPKKLGLIAQFYFDLYLKNSSDVREIFGVDLNDQQVDLLLSKVGGKLKLQPVENYRIDFEDGFGMRSGKEEDQEVERSAKELAKAYAAGTNVRFGIRVKSPGRATYERCKKTLLMFLRVLHKEMKDSFPKDFVICLPKVSNARELKNILNSVAQFERQNKIPRNSIKFEVMAETGSIFQVSNGKQSNLKDIVDACGKRLIGIHFGLYDYLSDIGIPAPNQTFEHSFCDFARWQMKNELAGMDLETSDGIVNQLPVPKDSRENVKSAWKRSFDVIQRQLGMGLEQGWDIHPGQLPVRYFATYLYFMNGMNDAKARMDKFVELEQKAQVVGQTFDDAATIRGLEIFFNRAVSSGFMEPRA